jgi:hypothetical protein
MFEGGDTWLRMRDWTQGSERPVSPQQLGFEPNGYVVGWGSI